MKKTVTTTENRKSTGHLFLNSSILVMLFIFFSFNGWGQTQLPQWSLPQNLISFNAIGISSNNPLPVPTGSSPEYYGQVAQWASNSYSDISGNLLFFIVDDQVYDKDGYFIDQLQFEVTPSGSMLLGGEISIVPVPGSSVQFYIIIGVGYVNSATYGPRFHPEYGVLDLSLPNPYYGGTRLGAMTYYSTTLPNDAGYSGINMINMYPFTGGYSYDPFDYTGDVSYEHETNRFGIAVTPYRCLDNKYFLYISGCNFIYRYNIDATGISFDDVGTSDSGIADPLTAVSGLAGNGDNTYYTELEIIRQPAGNYRLAKFYGNDYIEVDDFNDSDGTIISGSSKVINIYPVLSPNATKNGVGLEFSPNGNFLFYTYDIQNSYYTMTDYNVSGYTDLTATIPVATDFSFSGYYWNDYGYGASQIELGNDGNLYYNDGYELQTLDGFQSYPNGPASNWTGFSIPSAGGLSGTPNNPLLVDQIDGQDYSIPSYSGDESCCIIDHITTENYTANITDGYSTSTTQVWTVSSNPFIALWLAAHPTMALPSGYGTAAYPIVIGKNITIPAGYDVTMDKLVFNFMIRLDACTGNGTFSYGANASVLCGDATHGGAKLRLNNSTLTSFEYCGYYGMWEGVDVWGTPLYGGSLGKQGRIFMDNGSLISNAIIGITTGQKTAGYEPDFSTTANNGGNITCGDIGVPTDLNTFENNATDVFFVTNLYSYALSYFNYTTFVTDAQLHDNCLNPLSHAEIDFCAGPGFYACNFINNYPAAGLINSFPQTSPYSQTVGATWNIGIYAYQGSFGCNNGSDGTPCTFGGLCYGIKTFNSGTTRTMSCENAIFTQNWRGIYINTTNYASMDGNKFTLLPYNSPATEQYAPYGIYLDYSHGFSVEENYFTALSGNQQHINYGIIANQTNPKRTCGQADLININTFENIFIGIQTQGNNSESAIPACTGAVQNDVGLVLACNTFVQPTMGKFDINVADCIPPFGSLTYGNIAYLQGGTTITNPPANNNFSHTFCPTPLPPPTFNDYIVTATNDPGSPYYNLTNIIYPYFPGPFTEPYCYTPNAPPTYYGLSLSPQISSPTYNSTTGCQSTTGKNGGDLKSLISYYGAESDSLNAIINNGDRQGLIDTINSGDETTITATLMAASPYLSDRILLAAINKGMQATDIENILLANSPLTDTVKSASDLATLPSAVHTAIDNAQNGNLSARTNVQINASYSFGQKQRNLDALIRYNLKNTNITLAYDSVLQVLSDSTISPIKASSDSAKVYFTKGDLTTTSTLVEAIRATGQNDKYCDFMDVKIAVQLAGGNDSLILNDGTLLAKMQGVANDNTATESAAANALLNKLNGTDYNEWIQPVSSTSDRRLQHTPPKTTPPPVVQPAHTLAVYPVPATEQVTIEVNLPNGVTEGVLEIIDVTGRRLEKISISSNSKITVSTSDYAKGVYMCILKINETSALLDKQKIVIIK